MIAGGEAPQSSDLAFKTELSGPDLAVMWQNTSSHACLLNLGGVNGEDPIYIFKLSVSSSGEKGAAGIKNGTGVLEGRVDPWVIFMPSRSQFSVRIPLTTIVLNRSAISLAALKKPWKLQITFAGTAAADYAPGGNRIPFSLTRNGPTSIPICRGSLASMVGE
jgi:hypothetical protein